MDNTPLFIAALQLNHSIEDAQTQTEGLLEMSGYSYEAIFQALERLEKPFDDFWEGLPESLFEEWLEWQSSIICTDLYYHSVV